MGKPVAVDVTMQLDAYRILGDAVERGVALGYRRAHKHADHPDEAMLTDAVYDAVMAALCEVIRFPEAS